MSNRFGQWSALALGGGALVALFAGACTPSTDVVGSMDAGGASGADDGNTAAKSGTGPGSGGAGGRGTAGSSGGSVGGSGGDTSLAGSGGDVSVGGTGGDVTVGGTGGGGAGAGSGGTTGGAGGCSSTNCGECGNVCPSGSACIEGECSDELVCAPETADCDADSANGCETDIMTSPANCGSCGFTCAGTGSECLGAECVPPCPEPVVQGGCLGGLGFAKNPDLGAQCCEYAFGSCQASAGWTVYPTREACLAAEE